MSTMSSVVKEPKIPTVKEQETTITVEQESTSKTKTKPTITNVSRNEEEEGDQLPLNTTGQQINEKTEESNTQSENTESLTNLHSSGSFIKNIWTTELKKVENTGTDLERDEFGTRFDEEDTTPIIKSEMESKGTSTKLSETEFEGDEKEQTSFKAMEPTSTIIEKENNDSFVTATDKTDLYTDDESFKNIETTVFKNREITNTVSDGPRKFEQTLETTEETITPKSEIAENTNINQQGKLEPGKSKELATHSGFPNELETATHFTELAKSSKKDVDTSSSEVDEENIETELQNETENTESDITDTDKTGSYGGDDSSKSIEATVSKNKEITHAVLDDSSGKLEQTLETIEEIITPKSKIVENTNITANQQGKLETGNSEELETHSNFSKELETTTHFTELARTSNEDVDTSSSEVEEENIETELQKESEHTKSYITDTDKTGSYGGDESSKSIEATVSKNKKITDAVLDDSSGKLEQTLETIEETITPKSEIVENTNITANQQGKLETGNSEELETHSNFSKELETTTHFTELARTSNEDVDTSSSEVEEENIETELQKESENTESYITDKDKTGSYEGSKSIEATVSKNEEIIDTILNDISGKFKQTLETIKETVTPKPEISKNTNIINNQQGKLQTMNSKQLLNHSNFSKELETATHFTELAKTSNKDVDTFSSMVEEENIETELQKESENTESYITDTDKTDLYGEYKSSKSSEQQADNWNSKNVEKTVYEKIKVTETVLDDTSRTFKQTMETGKETIKTKSGENDTTTAAINQNELEAQDTGSVSQLITREGLETLVTLTNLDLKDVSKLPEIRSTMEPGNKIASAATTIINLISTFTTETGKYGSSIIESNNTELKQMEEDLKYICDPCPSGKIKKRIKVIKIAQSSSVFSGTTQNEWLDASEEKKYTKSDYASNSLLSRVGNENNPVGTNATEETITKDFNNKDNTQETDTQDFNFLCDPCPNPTFKRRKKVTTKMRVEPETDLKKNIKLMPTTETGKEQKMSTVSEKTMLGVSTQAKKTSTNTYKEIVKTSLLTSTPISKNELEQITEGIDSITQTDRNNLTVNSATKKSTSESIRSYYNIETGIIGYTTDMIFFQNVTLDEENLRHIFEGQSFVPMETPPTEPSMSGIIGQTTAHTSKQINLEEAELKEITENETNIAINVVTRELQGKRTTSLGTVKENKLGKTQTYNLEINTNNAFSTSKATVLEKAQQNPYTMKKQTKEIDEEVEGNILETIDKKEYMPSSKSQFMQELEKGKSKTDKKSFETPKKAEQNTLKMEKQLEEMEKVTDEINESSTEEMFPGVKTNNKTTILKSHPTLKVTAYDDRTPEKNINTEITEKIGFIKPTLSKQESNYVNGGAKLLISSQMASLETAKTQPTVKSTYSSTMYRKGASRKYVDWYDQYPDGEDDTWPVLKEGKTTINETKNMNQETTKNGMVTSEIEKDFIEPLTTTESTMEDYSGAELESLVTDEKEISSKTSMTSEGIKTKSKIFEIPTESPEKMSEITKFVIKEPDRKATIATDAGVTLSKTIEVSESFIQTEYGTNIGSYEPDNESINPDHYTATQIVEETAKSVGKLITTENSIDEESPEISASGTNLKQTVMSQGETNKLDIAFNTHYDEADISTDISQENMGPQITSGKKQTWETPTISESILQSGYSIGTGHTTNKETELNENSKSILTSSRIVTTEITPLSEEAFKSIHGLTNKKESYEASKSSSGLTTGEVTEGSNKEDTLITYNEEFENTSNLYQSAKITELITREEESTETIKEDIKSQEPSVKNISHTEPNNIPISEKGKSTQKLGISTRYSITESSVEEYVTEGSQEDILKHTVFQTEYIGNTSKTFISDTEYGNDEETSKKSTDEETYISIEAALKTSILSKEDLEHLFEGVIWTPSIEQMPTENLDYQNKSVNIYSIHPTMYQKVGGKKYNKVFSDYSAYEEETTPKTRTHKYFSEKNTEHNEPTYSERSEGPRYSKKEEYNAVSHSDQYSTAKGKELEHLSTLSLDSKGEIINTTFNGYYSSTEPEIFKNKLNTISSVTEITREGHKLQSNIFSTTEDSDKISLESLSSNIEVSSSSIYKESDKEYGSEEISENVNITNVMPPSTLNRESIITAENVEVTLEKESDEFSKITKQFSTLAYAGVKTKVVDTTPKDYSSSQEHKIFNNILNKTSGVTEETSKLGKFQSNIFSTNEVFDIISTETLPTNMAVSSTPGFKETEEYVSEESDRYEAKETFANITNIMTVSTSAITAKNLKVTLETDNDELSKTPENTISVDSDTEEDNTESAVKTESNYFPISKSSTENFSDTESTEGVEIEEYSESPKNNTEELFDIEKEETKTLSATEFEEAKTKENMKVSESSKIIPSREESETETESMESSDADVSTDFETHSVMKTTQINDENMKFTTVGIQSTICELCDSEISDARTAKSAAFEKSSQKLDSSVTAPEDVRENPNEPPEKLSTVENESKPNSANEESTQTTTHEGESESTVTEEDSKTTLAMPSQESNETPSPEGQSETTEEGGANEYETRSNEAGVEGGSQEPTGSNGKSSETTTPEDENETMEEDGDKESATPSNEAGQATVEGGSSEPSPSNESSKTTVPEDESENIEEDGAKGPVMPSNEAEESTVEGGSQEPNEPNEESSESTAPEDETGTIGEGGAEESVTPSNEAGETTVKEGIPEPSASNEESSEHTAPEDKSEATEEGHAKESVTPSNEADESTVEGGNPEPSASNEDSIETTAPEDQHETTETGSDKESVTPSNEAGETTVEEGSQEPSASNEESSEHTAPENESGTTEEGGAKEHVTSSNEAGESTVEGVSQEPSASNEESSESTAPEGERESAEKGGAKEPLVSSGETGDTTVEEGGQESSASNEESSEYTAPENESKTTERGGAKESAMHSDEAGETTAEGGSPEPSFSNEESSEHTAPENESETTEEGGAKESATPSDEAEKTSVEESSEASSASKEKSSETNVPEGENEEVGGGVSATSRNEAGQTAVEESSIGSSTSNEKPVEPTARESKTSEEDNTKQSVTSKADKATVEGEEPSASNEESSENTTSQNISETIEKGSDKEAETPSYETGETKVEGDNKESSTSNEESSETTVVSEGKLETSKEHSGKAGDTSIGMSISTTNELGETSKSITKETKKMEETSVQESSVHEKHTQVSTQQSELTSTIEIDIGMVGFESTPCKYCHSDTSILHSEDDKTEPLEQLTRTEYISEQGTTKIESGDEKEIKTENTISLTTETKETKIEAEAKSEKEENEIETKESTTEIEKEKNKFSPTTERHKEKTKETEEKEETDPFFYLHTQREEGKDNGEEGAEGGEEEGPKEGEEEGPEEGEEKGLEDEEEGTKQKTTEKRETKKPDNFSNEAEKTRIEVSISSTNELDETSAAKTSIEVYMSSTNELDETSKSITKETNKIKESSVHEKHTQMSMQHSEVTSTTEIDIGMVGFTSTPCKYCHSESPNSEFSHSEENKTEILEPTKGEEGTEERKEGTGEGEEGAEEGKEATEKEKAEEMQEEPDEEKEEKTKGKGEKVEEGNTDETSISTVTENVVHKPVVIVINNSGNKLEKFNKTILEGIIRKPIQDVNIQYIDIDTGENGSPTVINKNQPLRLGIPHESCKKADYLIGRNCFCNIQSYLDTLLQKINHKDTIKSKENYCNDFIRLKSGLLIENSIRPVERKRRGLIYLENLKKKAEHVEYETIEGLFENEYQLNKSESNLFCLPGETVKIRCTTRIDENGISWKFRPNSSSKDKLLLDKGAELVIHGVSIKDTGNYTCSKEDDKNVSETQHWHELEMITFPIYDIKMNIFYKFNDSCSLKTGDDLYTYLPKIVGPLLCPSDNDLCSVDVERPRCLTRADDNYFNVTMKAKISSGFVTTINDKCDINCKLRVYENLVNIIYKNTEILERVPVYSKLNPSSTIEFLPNVNGKEGSPVSSKPPKIMVFCPGGFGLESKRQSVCVACPAHTFSAGDEAFCKTCPGGQYQPDPGSISCIQCNSPVDNEMCLRMLYTDTKLFKIYVGVAFGFIVLMVIIIIVWTSGQKDDTTVKNSYFEGSLRHRATRRKDHDVETGVKEPLLGRSPKRLTPPKLPPVDF